MFSIAVVKKKFKSVILARDQFGQKYIHAATIIKDIGTLHSDPYSIYLCIKKV